MRNWRLALFVWFALSVVWVGYWTWRVHDAWTAPCAHCIFPPGFVRGVALQIILFNGLGPAVLVLMFGLVMAAGTRLFRWIRRSA